MGRKNVLLEPLSRAISAACAVVTFTNQHRVSTHQMIRPARTRRCTDSQTQTLSRASSAGRAATVAIFLMDSVLTQAAAGGEVSTVSARFGSRGIMILIFPTRLR